MKKFFMFQESLNDFKRDESGVTLALIALSFIGMVGSMGLAVDAARLQLVQSRLSNALDAAGLAASATVNTSNLDSEVEKYMNANFDDGYLESVRTSTLATVNADKTIITLSATATVPSTFMKIFGYGDSTVRADAQVTRAVNGLELVMALDNTGSMSGTKLTSLKNAANTLVGILYGDKETVEDLWIGLVPFAQAVNIGSSRTSWIDAADHAAKNWGNTTWKGCVDARHTGRDITDDPPSDELFKSYYWPKHSSYNDWSYSWSASKYTTSKGPNKSCSQEVTPLTSDKATLTTAISAMNAVGNTHTNLGAVWAWRMLSPRWRNLWGGQMDTDGLPKDYNTPKMNKAVVLMTDGDNTMSNSSHSAYWYLSDGRLGSTSSSAAEAKLDSNLTSVCTSMKNNNILVYTITFGSTTTAIQTLMRNCATQPDYYFNSPNDSDLQNAFSAIGDSLSNLRLSK